MYTRFYLLIALVTNTCITSNSALPPPHTRTHSLWWKYFSHLPAMWEFLWDTETTQGKLSRDQYNTGITFLKIIENARGMRTNESCPLSWCQRIMESEEPQLPLHWGGRFSARGPEATGNLSFPNQALVSHYTTGISSAFHITCRHLSWLDLCHKGGPWFPALAWQQRADREEYVFGLLPGLITLNINFQTCYWIVCSIVFNLPGSSPFWLSFYIVLLFYGCDIQGVAKTGL